MRVLEAFLIVMLALGTVPGLGLLGCGDDDGREAASCSDRDGDGYGDPASALCTSPQGDCDDTDPLVQPGTTEQCDNGIDDDCDGKIDLEDIACQVRPFSFVVLADPHIVGDATHEAKLSACVEWINAHRDEKKMGLVFIAGDIGWGDQGLAKAKEILDDLTVPYLPVIGDNEIQSGKEREFDAVFGPHYSALSTELDHWKRGSSPVPNPERGGYSYFQNFSFDHSGVHFMGIDWCTRLIAPIIGEQADLHDFPGGTWQWFQADISSCPREIEENIVMVSHHPMHPLAVGAFTAEEDRAVEGFTAQYGDNVYANFAGHYHIFFHQSLWAGGYELFITQAPWVGLNTMRLVEVDQEGNRASYSHELIPIP